MPVNKIAPFIRLQACFLMIAMASTLVARAGSLQQASVTEAVNTVSYQSNLDAPQKAVSVGTTIYPDNIVRTGVKSRAELQFNDKTITRIGANSAFSFDSAKQAMNLQEGTALFSKPKDNSTFEITTPAATCSISGTTGFLEVKPGKDPTHASFIFGLIEGHTTITAGGKSYNVGAGQLLVRTLGGSINFVSFNIPNFLSKAGLMKDFKSKLPNQADINKAVAKFVSLEKRGFIEATPLSLASNNGTVAFYLNALGDFHNFGGLNDQLNLSRQIQAFQGQIAQMGMGQQSNSGNGGFQNIGGSGIIHGQLVWNVYADLDLHLILPNGAGEVYYANSSITFNNGQATATLDHDNVGPVIDVQPTSRVENIALTGVPSSGTYQFYAHDFSSSGPVTYTLTTTGNNGATTQVQTGTLSGTGANSPIAVVTH
jgi:hypothetical protein